MPHFVALLTMMGLAQDFLKDHLMVGKECYFAIKEVDALNELGANCYSIKVFAQTPKLGLAGDLVLTRHVPLI